MVQENEVLTLILAIGVLLFVLVGKRGLQFPQRPVLLLAAFVAACGGWLFTVLEGFIAADACNVLEHACYAASSIVFVVWIWLVFGRTPQLEK